MARIVIFDEAHPLERVLRDLPSENTPDYDGRTDVVVNPDTSGLVEPMIYWRHDTGAIRDMDSGEKATLDAEIAAALLAGKRDGAKEQIDQDSGRGAILRALLNNVVKDSDRWRSWLRDFQTEIAAATDMADMKTRIASLPSYPDITLAQAITVLKSEIDAGEAD